MHLSSVRQKRQEGGQADTTNVRRNNIENWSIKFLMLCIFFMYSKILCLLKNKKKCKIISPGINLF